MIDPQRDVEQYLTDAEALRVRIRYVIETHLHADFVSGHRELADVADREEKVAEAVMRLARVGLENVIGALAGGMPAWKGAGEMVATLEQIGAGELKRRLGDVTVIDVRTRVEHDSGHVPAAINVPLPDLPALVASLDRSRPRAVICGGGYRSSTTASPLLRHSFDVRSNVSGGIAAWAAAGYEMER